MLFLIFIKLGECSVLNNFPIYYGTKPIDSFSKLGHLNGTVCIRVSRGSFLHSSVYTAFFRLLVQKRCKGLDSGREPEREPTSLPHAQWEDPPWGTYSSVSSFLIPSQAFRRLCLTPLWLSHLWRGKTHQNWNAWAKSVHWNQLSFKRPGTSDF